MAQDLVSEVTSIHRLAQISPAVSASSGVSLRHVTMSTYDGSRERMRRIVTVAFERQAGGDRSESTHVDGPACEGLGIHTSVVVFRVCADEWITHANPSAGIEAKLDALKSLRGI
jgi:hypothetical protein